MSRSRYGQFGLENDAPAGYTYPSNFPSFRGDILPAFQQPQPHSLEWHRRPASTVPSPITTPAPRSWPYQRDQQSFEGQIPAYARPYTPHNHRPSVYVSQPQPLSYPPSSLQDVHRPPLPSPHSPYSLQNVHRPALQPITVPQIMHTPIQSSFRPTSDTHFASDTAGKKQPSRVVWTSPIVQQAPLPPSSPAVNSQTGASLLQPSSVQAPAPLVDSSTPQSSTTIPSPFSPPPSNVPPASQSSVPASSSAQPSIAPPSSHALPIPLSSAVPIQLDSRGAVSEPSAEEQEVERSTYKSTWAERNPGNWINPPRSHPISHQVRDRKVRAEIKSSRQKRRQNLTNAVENLRDHLETRFQEIATEHGQSVPYIRNLFFYSSGAKTKRDINLYNALLSHKAGELNEG